MDNHFSKRIKSGEYEILSSYLSKMASANGVDIERIIKYALLPNESQEIAPRRMHQIDVFPKSIIDVSNLSKILKLESNLIENMTFSPLIDKLIINENHDHKVHLYSLLQHVIVTQKRRFCPKCIKQYGFYKILWQINEIKICNEHYTLLESNCPKCFEELPYYFKTLHEFRCPKCGYLLFNGNLDKDADNQTIKRQMLKYKNWLFLLNSNTELVSTFNGLTKEQSLAIKLLYVSQRCNNKFNKKSVEFLGNTFVNKLIKKANGITDNYQIRAFVILRLLSQLNMSVEEFSSLKISESFINSLYNYDESENRPLGPCLSPWCKSFGKTDSIKMITGRKFYYEKYEMGSVCTKCNIKFGYSRKTNEWESIDNEVELIWEKIKPLLDQGLTRNQIKNQYKIGEETVYRIFGYLLYHQLLPEDTFKVTRTKPNQGNLVKEFRKLMVSPGDMVSNAKKQFGWSKDQYYYYLANEKVQEFIIFYSDELRKKFASCKSKGDEYWRDRVNEEIERCLNEGIDIEVSMISKRLKCIAKTLYKHNLVVLIKNAAEKQNQDKKEKFQKQIIEIADKFLEQMRPQMKKVSLKELFTLAGTYDKIMRSKYPDITEKMLRKVEDHNNWITQMENQKDYEKILEGIKFLEENGQNIKLSNLRELTGLSVHVIKKRMENNAYFNQIHE